MKYTFALCFLFVAIANAMTLGQPENGVKLRPEPIEMFKLMVSKNVDLERVQCGCCGVVITCKNNLLEPEFFLKSTNMESRLRCSCCGWIVEC